MPASIESSTNGASLTEDEKDIGLALSRMEYCLKEEDGK